MTQSTTSAATTSAARLVIVAMTTLALGLGACGTDEDSSPADVSSLVIESDADGVIGYEDTESDVDTESDAPAATSSGTDAQGSDSTGVPTGQLTLDGETFELTFDADDPNALCQKLPGNMMAVSGMRTPAGNRVDITVQDIPRDNAMATYYGDDETPLWSSATDGSSTPPEWSVDGTTVQLTGTWFNRIDTSLAEVDGELIITC
jgi:hypothetical protein